MRVFDHIASRYDLGMLPLEWCFLDRLRRSLHPLPGQSVLELGVGTGANLAHYGPDSTVVAVDLSREMLAMAASRRTAAHVSCVRANVERLPFRANSFDTVLTSLLFCSVERPESGLAEIKRVLLPGGRLVMLEHVRGDRWPTRGLTDRLDRWWFGLNGSCHLNRDTEAMVRASGMRIVKTTRHLGGIFQVIMAASPRDYETT